MNPNWKILLALIGTMLLSVLGALPALAQETPTPTELPLTPTPEPAIPELPPGDTTILVIAAILLVLIVLGAVVWLSRRSR